MSCGSPTLTDRSRAISVSSHAGKRSGVGIGLETCVCSNETPLLFVQTGVAQDLTCARSTMEPNQNATGARIVILTQCQQVFHSVTTLQENQRKQSELPATRHPGFEMQILTSLFCSTRLRADTYCWVC